MFFPARYAKKFLSRRGVNLGSVSAVYSDSEAIAAFICLAEASRACRSSPLRGISRISFSPFRPTMEGMLRARPSRPYCPESTTDTGSTARSSLTMHAAMRPTAIAMP